MKKYQKLFMWTIYRKFFIYFMITSILIVWWVKLIQYLNVNKYVDNFFKLWDKVSIIQWNIDTKMWSKYVILYWLLDEKYNKKLPLEFDINEIKDYYLKHNDEILAIKWLNWKKDIEFFDILMENIWFLSQFWVINNNDVFLWKKVYSFLIKNNVYTYDINWKNINMYLVQNLDWTSLFSNSEFTFDVSNSKVNLLVKQNWKWLNIASLDQSNNNKKLIPNNDVLKNFDEKKQNALANLYELYFKREYYFWETTKNAFIIKKKKDI